MDLTHSTDLTTVTTEGYIPGSKSTDFIKPKGSSNNLEAQNQGKLQTISGQISNAKKIAFLFE